MHSKVWDVAITVSAVQVHEIVPVVDSVMV